MRCFRFAIDRGGTFTDVYAEKDEYDDQGKIKQVQCKVVKLLSEDPSNYPDAPREGIRRILEEMTQTLYPRHQRIDTKHIQSIRMGTTVATNALLERNGASTILVINRSFQDLLYIGDQSRPKIFDLKIQRPEMLYENVIQVDERVQLIASDRREAGDIEGISGDYVRIVHPVDTEKVRHALEPLYDRENPKSIAIVLLHSYTFPQHEETIAKIARDIGFQQVSCSSHVMPMVKAVPRGLTTCADAYLTPVIQQYLKSFCSGFDDGFNKVDMSFMQSDGGLATTKEFQGHRAVLSGPAAGVVGYARTTQVTRNGLRCPVIGFDMGGTSTDVSRFDQTFEHVLESVTANVPIRAPQLDIQTIAAGGGSRLFYKSGMFLVGPESVRAHPGPVCYRKKGFLSVTDANLVTGRILPQFFPHIFGPEENQPLDIDGARAAFTVLCEEINADPHTNAQYTLEEVACGFLRVANEAMCRPIRNLTQMRGHDITGHVLACFGGAGPQHACSIARTLGISQVYVHRYSGVLSAYGLSVADSVLDKQRPYSLTYDATSKPKLVQALVDLAKGISIQLNATTYHFYLNMRFEGTDTALMIRGPELDVQDPWTERLLRFDFERAFVERYQNEFGFLMQSQSIRVDDVRVRAIISPEIRIDESKHVEAVLSPHSTTPLYFEDERMWKDVDVYLHEDLMSCRGAQARGPAIIMQGTATVVVEKEWTFIIQQNGDLLLESDSQSHSKAAHIEIDPIQLSVFSHRFMSIAEQMGRTLSQTSVSVNIKERLDFSCALFDATGGLVANAPHLPVHLGAMQQAVRYQLEFWKDDLVPGDVLVSNHPQLAGGSHLPDITVITPVFGENQINFFVASRGHHADIGGIAPGSMPPLSKTLAEEGAAIIAFKLVDGRNNRFREEEIADLLLQKNVPNAIGTRNLRDNLSDLKAQVAANNRGVTLLHKLCEEFTLQVVSAYMKFIQQAAETAVGDMLVRFSLERGLAAKDSVRARDLMDDGTEIVLEITIDRVNRSAIFDFTGTGVQVFGNVNTPPAVTFSAIIYCLRCLIPGEDLPLNQGCLNPIHVIFPNYHSILNPSDDAAVVGGNVLTSQRITDVILRAFGACAASQGCMNNLTFGSDSLGGYYETIAGGAGAGPSWHGQSGIQTHMTNTRITDVEILEKRFPVMLEAFHLREYSGGDGRFHGGQGVVRTLLFLERLTVSILSERRVFEPYGMLGGKRGKRGLNLLQRKNGCTVNLGGKNTTQVDAGDRVSIQTPGGGGFGAAE
ncbi:unnamed protein product [Albugo candida]|uniref:5-oxoprolinase n=1 Tax=Albugo candida TaxID=65357 RepID=A0A024GNU8_9STRA|nr:unnamed protein product [Albugo candida]|eukprot:CCI48567.1 unnamed protein product [Albugo candida]